MTPPLPPELDGPDSSPGDVVDDADATRLPTFAEMLPATRAFHRRTATS